MLENGESIRQNIYRYGVYAGADFNPTRTWAFGGEYRYGHYSDKNDMNQFNLYNEVSLTLPPKQLKFVQQLYFQGFAQQTVFNQNPPDPHNLRGTIHPYFSPKDYANLEFRIEYWEWLSRDYFVHSNQCWYSLQYGIAGDNNSNVYHDLRALVNYDVCSWLSVGATTQAYLSNVYRSYSAMGYLQIRFLTR